MRIDRELLILRRNGPGWRCDQPQHFTGVGDRIPSRQTAPRPAMFAGALAAGIFTTIIMSSFTKISRKQDAAIASLFDAVRNRCNSNQFVRDRVDLDQECVLYARSPSCRSHLCGMGNTLGPEPVVRMAVVAILTTVLIVLFYKELW